MTSRQERREANRQRLMEMNPLAPLSIACLSLFALSVLAVTILMGFHMIWSAWNIAVIIANVAVVTLCFWFYRVLRARRRSERST